MHTCSITEYQFENIPPGSLAGQLVRTDDKFLFIFYKPCRLFNRYYFQDCDDLKSKLAIAISCDIHGTESNICRNGSIYLNFPNKL